MNVATVPVHHHEARSASGQVWMSAPVRATAHACLRYGQRVLGLPLEEEQIRRDWALRRRCEGGITRLMERAHLARTDGEVDVWVARTRALVVRDQSVLTVLVSATSRGFGKRFSR
jgi:hypothetical protein